MYFVYILKSLKDNKYYIGSTSDIQKRLIFHNSGLQRSTKSRVPFELVYQEEYPDKRSAIAREMQIKSYKGGEAFKKLIRGG
jgi:putative endonuclease